MGEWLLRLRADSNGPPRTSDAARSCHIQFTTGRDYRLDTVTLTTLSSF
jgi:hypothetical protein